MRARAALIAALLGALLQVPVAAGAVDLGSCSSPASTSAAASSARASSARTACPAAPADPSEVLYNQSRLRLSADLNQALATQRRLSATLEQERKRTLTLTSQIRQQQARITALERQVRELDRQIALSQDRIAVEQSQVTAMARAMYRRPESLPVLWARSGNLREALQVTADLLIAGERAHSLQVRLEADLARQSADRQARQTDLRRAASTRRELETSLRSLDDIIRGQVMVIDELQSVIARIRQALSGLHDQPPAVIATLTQLLEHLQQSVVLRSYQLAVHQVRAGAGLALSEGSLMSGRAVLPIGIKFGWPLPDSTVTQGFGPTDFWLAPPLGAFPHYHTGVDLAAPEASPVLAAADGIVASVTRSSVGYGNYVIVEHEPGVVTLYAHLLDAAVSAGDKVTRGQPVGFEGSTGFSTGAHLHFELRVNDQFVDPMQYLATPTARPAPTESAPG